MTPLFLQDSLNKRIESILSPMELMGGRKFIGYTQEAPPQREDKDDSLFPFFRVLLGEGEDGNEDAVQDVVIVLATRDPSRDRQGYRDVMNAIQRLREHFSKDPDISRRFTIQKPIRWRPPDPGDNTFPEFYGAIQFKVELPQVPINYKYEE